VEWSHCKSEPFDYFVEEYAEEFPFTYDQMLQQELTAYLNLSVPIHGGLKLSINTLMIFVNQSSRLQELSYNLRWK
jgi:hypothetical protein